MDDEMLDRDSHVFRCEGLSDGSVERGAWQGPPSRQYSRRRRLPSPAFAYAPELVLLWDACLACCCGYYSRQTTSAARDWMTDVC